MRRIELAPQIQSSVIGFGCAPILGAVGRVQAERAINVALDVGINHFDLARSYGYGRAEAMLGSVLRGKRDQVVLATKFGIKASAAAYFLSPLKPLVRALRPRRSAAGTSGSSPPRPEGTGSNRLASFLHKRVPLDAATMQRSLETSLRALRTEWVDYLFVHEPAKSLGNIDELMTAAELLKKQGKIRAWGLAFSYESRPMHASYLQLFDVLQFNASPCAPDYRDAVAERADKPNILFSPFRHRAESPEPLSPAAILRCLATDFPSSVILCSMFSEAHIRANAAAVADA